MENLERRGIDSASPYGGRLQVYAGDFQGEIIPLKEGETIFVGRDLNKCAIICNSSRVSRVHVSISCRTNEEGQTEYVVRDLSSNGTISSMTGYLPKDQDVMIYGGTEIGLGQSDETIRFL